MPNRLISRVLRLTIDNFRAFAILGFLPTETGIKPTYLRINIKPYEQTIDKEVKAHSISITNNLEEGKTFDSIVEDHTKESIVGNVLHHIKNNLEDIVANVQPDKAVRLSTDPYRKIK